MSVPVGSIVAAVLTALGGLAVSSASEKAGNAVQKKQDEHQAKKAAKKK